jgi:thiamine-phosphate pyrophosphorylase
LFPALYAIFDPALTGEPLISVAHKLVSSGVRLVQLRAKRSPARKTYADSGELVEQLSHLGVRVIINDRPDIAAITGAGGVHVGQEDLPVEEARKICGNTCWVGVSTHSIAQLRAADLTSADYIAVGPVFPTLTKDNPDPVIGLDFLRRARALTRKPLVAIGGITVESAGEVFRAGADSVAVIRDLMAAPDPSARAAEYLSIAERVRAARS